MKKLSVFLTVLTLLVTLCMPIGKVHADDNVTVTFKDPVLYNSVVSYIENQYKNVTTLTKDDANNQISLSENDLEKIGKLSLQDARGSVAISDLTGLEQFTALTNLKVDNQCNNRGEAIHDGGYADLTPLSGLTNLKKLTLEGTNAENINAITGLMNLKELKIVGNGKLDITGIDALKDLEKIEIINCGLDNDGFNKITNLSGLKHLVIGGLNFEGNNVSDISSVSKLENLYYLNINNNKITDLSPISNLSGLKYLCARSNPITDITPVGKLENLHTLILGRDGYAGNDEGVPIDGKIEAIAQLSNLKELKLSHCGITDISCLTPILGNLHELDLSSNHISDFSPLYNTSQIEDAFFNVYRQSYSCDVKQGETVAIPDTVIDALTNSQSRFYCENFAEKAQSFNCTLSEDCRSVTMNDDVSEAEVYFKTSDGKLLFKINYNVERAADTTAPEVTVYYSTQKATYDSVEATITASEPIQDIEGFTKVDDRTYTKSYSKNINTDITVYDLAGNKTIVNISISNIMEKPQEPEEPDTPQEPETPTTPDTPQEPETPATPDTPQEPETPATPDTPQEPETPITPDEPTIPAAPATPDTPTVKTPVTKTTPKNTEKSKEAIKTGDDNSIVLYCMQ